MIHSLHARRTTLIVLITLFLVGCGNSNELLVDTETATIAQSSQPTSTTTSQQIPTIDPSIPPACTEIGQRWLNPKDGGEMVCVPAGEFWMGAAEGDNQALDDEKPGRQVFLDAYWIDRFEVTNAQYKTCVDAGVCTSPTDNRSNTRSSYYGTDSYQNFPVSFIDWNQANAYCAWVGEGLPSEAQWEKAGRGTDGRLYPWGNQAPTGSLANFSTNDTDAVGSYPAGVSIYGAEDMAGNVWEWIADWYSGTYYQITSSRNPAGPEEGDGRVVRGSSWANGKKELRSSARGRISPELTGNFLGFRCSFSPR